MPDPDEYDIPEEFYEDAVTGELRGGDLREWLDERASDEAREFFDEAFEHNLSAEWGVILASEGLSSNPHDWDNVLISRDMDGDWAVVITEDGESVSVSFKDDDIADDLIWSDLYWHLLDEGVDFDKEIDSGEAA